MTLGRGGVRDAASSFFRSEVSGGAVLSVAAVAALVWANSPWSGGYTAMWMHATRLGVHAVANLSTVQDWVNGGLMTAFFLVVGLEIAREHRDGALGDFGTALVPVAGAAGGMAGAALVYVLVNHGGTGARGWGIPMATDIAFVLGALALLGRWVPRGLRLLLLALAVADDIASVVVLAVFYPGRTDVSALVVAAVVTGGMVVLRRFWHVSAWPYLVGGVVLWLALAQGGVEPAIAGVVIGMLVPGAMRTGGGDPAGRLEILMAPISAYVVLPLFALANVGVAIHSTILRPPGATGVFFGIVVARVVGKLGGITVACLVVVRLGLGRLPEGVHWGHVVGGAAIAGIGFTVPVLIAQRAFADAPHLIVASTVGLLAGSAIAFVVGTSVLAIASRRSAPAEGNPGPR